MYFTKTSVFLTALFHAGAFDINDNVRRMTDINKIYYLRPAVSYLNYIVITFIIYSNSILVRGWSKRVGYFSVS
jgi:hypothetical protein